MKNLSVSGSVTVDKGSLLRADGMAGYNAGTIRNCRHTGLVSSNGFSTTQQIGGIVGYNVRAVASCSNAGIVQSTEESAGNIQIGGVAGSNSGSVTGCCSTAEVTCASLSSYSGGVTGNNIRTVQNCYSTGMVTVSGSESYAGSITGRQESGSFTNCYGTGAVVDSGSDNCIGGAIGWLENGSVTNCFFLQDDTHNAGLPIVGQAGEETTVGAVPVDSAGFASGQMARLLQDWWNTNASEEEKGQVWGQKIGADDTPVLSGDSGHKVYQLTFRADGADEIVLYGNSGNLQSPADPTPPAGLVFTGWFSGGTKLTETSVISADIVATAQFGTTQEPEPEPPSGGSSSRPSQPEPSEPPEPPVDVTTEDTIQNGQITIRTTARPPAEVENGSASASISSNVGQEIVQQAKENNSTSVVIAPEISGDVTSAQISSPLLRWRLWGRRRRPA